jgi:hypothetical protein
MRCLRRCSTLTGTLAKFSNGKSSTTKTSAGVSGSFALGADKMIQFFSAPLGIDVVLGQEQQKGSTILDLPDEVVA